MLACAYVSESVSPVHGLVESLWLVCRCGYVESGRSVGFVGLSCGEVSHLHGGGKDISCPRKKEPKSPLEGKPRFLPEPVPPVASSPNAVFTPALC